MNDVLESFATHDAVDVTAFLGAFPWRLQAANDSAALRRQADRLGLSGLCLSNLASVFGYDTRSGNEELLRATSAESRFWYTPVINPTDPAWEAELAWVLSQGARGVRMVPGYHQFTLRHPAVADLVAAATEAGFAIHVSATLEDPRERHRHYFVEECTLSDVADFLRTAIGIPVVISGLRTYDWTDVYSSLDHGHDLDGVILDMWRMNGPVGAIRQMCDAGWASMLVYGTCQPVQEAVASAYQLGSANVTDENRQALAASNARRVLDSVQNQSGLIAP